MNPKQFGKKLGKTYFMAMSPAKIIIVNCIFLQLQFMYDSWSLNLCTIVSFLNKV